MLFVSVPGRPGSTRVVGKPFGWPRWEIQARVRGRLHGVFSRGLGLLGHIQLPAAHVHGFTGGGQSLEDDGTGLRRQTRLQDQGAVVVVVEFHGALLVQGVGPLAFGNTLDLAVVAHQAFHVGGGSAVGNVQEVVLVLRCRDPGHRAHLGVAHLAAAEGCADSGQGLQAAGDPHLVTGGAQADAALPIEPMGAGKNPPLAPALAAVELRDEAQQTVVGRVDVGGELGDLAFQGIQRAGRHG